MTNKSGNPRPYFKFYPSDWLSHPETRALNLEEKGAFIELLANMWKREDGRLKDDSKFISRLLNVHVNKWRRLREELVDNQCVIRESGGYLYSQRLTKELKTYREISESRSLASQKRWEG